MQGRRVDSLIRGYHVSGKISEAGVRKVVKNDNREDSSPGRIKNSYGARSNGGRGFTREKKGRGERRP